jgi:30S ribosomal protein S31
MGRGDRRTAKGKRFRGSFGNTRPQRKKKAEGAPVSAPKKAKVVKEVKAPKPKAAKKTAAADKPKKAPAKKKKAEE